MDAAAEGRGLSKVNLLAVTVLTSFDQSDLADLGYEVPISDLVELRVRKAAQSGTGPRVAHGQALKTDYLSIAGTATVRRRLVIGH